VVTREKFVAPFGHRSSQHEGTVFLMLKTEEKFLKEMSMETGACCLLRAES